MRILFNGFQSPHLVPVLTELRARFGLDYIATVDERPSRALEGIEHDHHNVWSVFRGDYARPEHEWLPLDRALVDRMAYCETVVLRMMDRLDALSTTPYETYATRKALYLKHLQYWHDFLVRKKITHFIATNIPHEVYDYVIYSLCKHLGIETLMFRQSMLPDATFLFRDYTVGPADLASAFEALPKDEPVSLEPYLEQYWAERTAPKTKAAEPFYMKAARMHLTSTRSPFYVFRRFATFRKEFATKYGEAPLTHIVSDGLRRFRVRREMFEADEHLWAHYRSLTQAPDLQAKFIYVPLHMQPECSTSPLGGAFVEQDLMVRLLAGVVPPGVQIYVKEHPVQTSKGRETAFYDRLKALPNVRFMPLDTSSAMLIEHSLAVATVTGTAGWEALFAEKPVLLFGYFFYQYASGVFTIDTVEDAKSAVNKILEGFRPTVRDLRRFHRAVQDTAVRAYADEFYKPVSSVTPEQNAKNLAEALVAQLAPSSERAR